MTPAVAVPLPLSLLFFVLGIVLGSFGNVLIARLPAGKPVTGRSACPHCHKTLGAGELVPIGSFIVQRGACRGCRKRISWQYPLVEVGSGLLFLWALLDLYPSVFLASILAVALWLLLLIAVVDLRTGLVPDALSIPFVAVSFFHAALWWSVGIWFFPVYLALVFQGAAIAGGFFLLLWLAGRGRFVGSGDVILAAGVGFLLPDVPRVLVALFSAFILGALVASFLLVVGKKRFGQTLSFGPFLAAATVLTLLWGDRWLAAMGF